MRRPRFHILTLLLAGLLLAASATCALAQTKTLRQQVYERLTSAQEATEAGDYEKAFHELERLDRIKDLQPHELAQIHTAYGYLHFAQEDYDKAAASYEQVLAQPELAEAMRTTTLYTLGQLHFHLEHYDQALRHLDQWLAVADNPGPEPYVLKGQALYQLGRLDEAAAPVKQAIAIAEERDRAVQESWYGLLRVIYFESQDYPDLLDVLEILVSRFPSREYWLHLAGAYGELGDTARQLAAFEMAHQQGFLRGGSELVMLAQLYLQAEVPYRAGELLQGALDSGQVEGTADNWRLLSQSWMLAQEHARAIASLETAAGLSDDGELDARIAQTHANMGNWELAAQAAATALQKGVDDPQDLHMLRGMGFFELGQFTEARDAFTQAMRYEEGRETASRWLAYVEREAQRVRELGLR